MERQVETELAIDMKQPFAMAEEGKKSHSLRGKELTEPIRRSLNSSNTTFELARPQNLRKVNSKVVAKKQVGLYTRSMLKSDVYDSSKFFDKELSVTEMVKESAKDIKSSNNMFMTDNQYLMMTDLTDLNKKDSYVKSISKMLRLEVMEKGIIPAGTVIKIRPQGLIGSKRNAQDGNVYFGTKSSPVTSSANVTVRTTHERLHHRGARRQLRETVFSN